MAAAVGGTSDHARSIADVILQDIIAAKGAALITSLLILGILFAVLLADVVGSIRLQVFGFIGCAVGLFLASLSAYFTDGEELLLIFAGFMLFNFMTNLGPNAQTYLLAGEVFPTAIRGKGAGFAAAFAKIGAVLTAFLFPVLLDFIGTQSLLYGLIATSLLGGDHLAIPDRDDRSEPRNTQRKISGAPTMTPVARPVSTRNARRMLAAVAVCASSRSGPLAYRPHADDLDSRLGDGIEPDLPAVQGLGR